MPDPTRPGPEPGRKQDDRPSPLSRPATQRGVAFAIGSLVVIAAALFFLFVGADTPGDLVETPEMQTLLPTEETASTGSEGEHDAVIEALGGGSLAEPAEPAEPAE